MDVALLYILIFTVIAFILVMLAKEQQDRLKNAFPGNFIVEDELIPRLNDLVDELAEDNISFERLWLAVISCATEELERLTSSNFVKW